MKLIDSSLVQPALRAVFRPFDVSTPMRRGPYWLHHLATLALTYLAMMLVAVLRPWMLSSGWQAGSSVLDLALAGALLWLVLGLVTASARRMKDSGHRRKSLIASIGLGTFFFISLARDIQTSLLVAELQGVPSSGSLVFSGSTFILFLMAMTASFLVFRGLVKKSTSAEGAPTDQ